MAADLPTKLFAFARLLREEDVNMSVEELLCFLGVATRPGLSVGELAVRTGLPQSTVSRHVKRLATGAHHSSGGFGPVRWELEVEGPGLLEQRVHPVNAKQKALHATAKGAALLARFDKVLAA